MKSYFVTPSTRDLVYKNSTKSPKTMTVASTITTHKVAEPYKTIVLSLALLLLAPIRINGGGNLGGISVNTLLNGGMTLGSIVSQLTTTLNPALSPQCSSAIANQLLPAFSSCGGLQLFHLIGGSLSAVNTGLTASLCTTPQCANALYTFNNATLTGCGNITTAIINPLNTTATGTPGGVTNLLSLIGGLGVNQLSQSLNSSLALACLKTADANGYCLNQVASMIAVAEGLAPDADVNLFDTRAQSLLATPQIACTDCVQRQVATALSDKTSLAYRLVQGNIAAAQSGLSQCNTLSVGDGTPAAPSPTSAGDGLMIKPSGRGQSSASANRAAALVLMPVVLVVSVMAGVL
ncbi:hypothetical protein SeMB42_g07171 [Synchytrium endobioticum]|uniref:SPARK domain-containing protein n=1 Tax=Synchytrium endobioticum TaxID=286115 RepID=A0A507CCY0_9FUNG|nr:hypothetical protein SeMB42_g07171 [Synchytrium endobioticum]TPX50119.1 hypothetical protein SeLEV6574_g01067 [Synchytrium endobioticum]